MTMLNIKGTVLYDPDRGKLKQDKAKNTIIIEIEEGEDFAAYYRYFFNKKIWLRIIKT